MTATLSSERLILRPWRDADLDALAAMSADPEVMVHFPATLDRVGSAELLGKLTAHQAAHGFTFWCLERQADGRVIGFTGLARVSFAAPFVPAVEIGWRLARPFWGQGYALEAARRALDFAFDDLDLPEVVSFTVPANQRSWGVMQRLGMRRDPADDFEHPNLPPGHPLRPHLLYRIARDDWHGR
ncbi:GNAT family N-acetyltransferase [Pseudomonas sp. BMS12]|uniref:GNAT family N-acetyltransferase n=1 Tax=Pseudomonas sp. BMS12 TaxID=1796033 RepID=UPI00083B4DBC|nr:GNAT family N-acetyltransferase [Pseudomonas sp. BMS12]